MSELKVYHCNEWHNEYTEFYIKSEADKVIAELEESHKMEVEQLLIEIAELRENNKKAFERDAENWNRLCVKYNKLIELKKDFCEKFKDIELEIDK